MIRWLRRWWRKLWRYPFECELCHHMIMSAQDLEWHGYGNCVEITDAQWQAWGKESSSDD